MKQLTEVEIINETVEYYKNNERATSGGYCRYRTNPGNKCAIGRVMTDSAIAKFGGYIGGITSLKGSKELEALAATIDDLLKPQYKGHHISFWTDLQDFHDVPENWNQLQLGLTKDGEKVYRYLIDMYSK